MDIDSVNQTSKSHNESECGCGNLKECDNSSKEGCGCGCGCGCGGDGPGNQYLTLVLEDDSELKCQILGIFVCNGNTYIALLKPTDESVLLLRYILKRDRSFSVEAIEDDEEYEMVSKLFVAMHEFQYEIVE